MPYTLKTNQISVKDPETGEYSGVDILAEQTEQGLIAELQAEGTTQVNRINQAAVDVQSAVDKAETDAAKIISDTQASVNTLEAQKNTIAQTIASMAELGTDMTLSTPGMAADAGAVGDLSRQISDVNNQSFRNLIGNVRYRKYPLYIKKNQSFTFGTVDGTAADSDIAVYLFSKTKQQLDFFNLNAGVIKRTVSLNLSADVYYAEIRTDSTKEIYLVVGKDLGAYYPYFGSPYSVDTKLSTHDSDIKLLERMSANHVGAIDFISDLEVGSLSTGALFASNIRLRSANYHAITNKTIVFKFYNTGYQIAIDEYNVNKSWIRESQYLSNDSVITYTCTSNCAYVKLIIKAVPDVNFNAQGIPELLNFTAEHPTVNILPNKIKIISYNVGLYTAGINRDWTDADDASITKMRQILSQQNCDVAGITEVRPAIKTSTDRAQIYDYLYPQRYESSELGGSGIFSRFPIGNYATATFSTGRTYRYATMFVNGTEVFMLLLHLSPTWTNKREIEIAEVLPLLENHEYFIACGDFNAGNDTGGGLSEYQAYIDAGYHMASGGYLGGLVTYSGNRYLDNIITSSNIIICNSYVPTIADNPSDHLPIIAELQVT